METLHHALELLGRDNLHILAIDRYIRAYLHTVFADALHLTAHGVALSVTESKRIVHAILRHRVAVLRRVKAVAAKHGIILGLNVGIRLVKFRLWVYGLAQREDLVGTGKLVFARLRIANHNALVGVAHVYARAVGKRNDVALDDIHLSVVHLHGGRLHQLIILVRVPLHIGGNLPALVLHGIVRCVMYAVHRGLGVDVVEHCILLVFRQFGIVEQRPRIFFHLSHTHFRVRSKSVLAELVGFFHADSNGVHFGFRVGIALLHLVPQKARLVING